jgi:hypothetical protein
VCDDFFGRTEYDPSRVSSWQTDLPHVIPRLNSSHWLILTTRAHLLEMAKPNLDVAGHNDQFLTLGEVLVDAGKLTTGEKARILYRHAKAAGLGRPSKDIIKRHAMRVISNPHFTPERIRRLVTSGLGTLSNGGRAHGEKEIEKRIDAAINDPTKQMRTSFRALPVRHRWLLYALLETEERTPIFTMEEGTVAETLEERFERLCPQEHQEAFASVAAEMSEAFVKRLPALFGEGRISWIHPSVRDLAIGELRANGRERRRFLSRCSGQGLQLATSLAGGEMGLREMPLLSDEEDWEIFKARCIALINEGRISSACCGGTSKRRGKLKGQTLRLG